MREQFTKCAKTLSSGEQRECMQSKLDLLFKPAADAVKEPWESHQRGLGRLVM